MGLMAIIVVMNGIAVARLYGKFPGAVPFLYATRIYNPPVVHHGHCIAEPGTFNALFCMGRTEAPHNQKYRAR